MGTCEDDCSEFRKEPLHSALEPGDDLKEVLTVLCEEADRAAAMGVQLKEHASVSFYRGSRAVRVRFPPAKGDEGNLPSVVEKSLHVIALHQELLLPCSGDTSFSDEEQSARLSSSYGLEFLRLNWKLLLSLLFPSVRFATGMGEEKEKEEKNDGETSVEEGSPADSLISVWEISHSLTWEDYKQLRQPSMMDRIHYSYVCFLRFYGWRLYDEESGVLDRHQNWKLRYKILLKANNNNNIVHDESAGACDSEIGFYSGLSRILCVLLELCLTRYAVNLVAFLLEEMSKGRLLFLQRTLEEVWLPQVLSSKQVAESEKERVRRQLYRLTHSDSD